MKSYHITIIRTCIFLLIITLQPLNAMNVSDQDTKDIGDTQKAFAALVTILKNNARQVQYLEIDELPTPLKKSERYSSPLAVEISNSSSFQNFGVYLHSPCGLLIVARGDLKTHCDFLTLDFANTPLKTSKPKESGDYGEVNLKYNILSIAADSDSKK